MSEISSLPSRSKPPCVGCAPKIVTFAEQVGHQLAVHHSGFVVQLAVPPSNARPTCDQPNGPIRRSPIRNFFSHSSVGSPPAGTSEPSENSKRPPFTLSPGT